MKVVALLSIEKEREKYLLQYNGEEIIQHVINYTKKLDFVEKIVLITDDNYFEKYSKEVNEIFYIRKADCRCASERVFKYYQKDNSFDYYLSIPTLDPTIDSAEINSHWKSIETLTEPEGVSSFYSQFNNIEDVRNTKFCKVVLDEDDALYFSRAPIPLKKDGRLADLDAYKKNVELFIFPNKLLKFLGEGLWGDWKSPLADIEELEQNRFLQFGLPVYIEKINHRGFSIESEEDIVLLQQRLSV